VCRGVCVWFSICSQVTVSFGEQGFVCLYGLRMCICTDVDVDL
jgi:hypothetical protein